MRPVNLLPARYRPRVAGSSDPKSAYFALGALGMVILAIFVYVMAANKVSATNSEIAEARAQITAAQSKAVTFQEFGDFASIKETRLAAVKSLATARLDWERVFREMAHVLPEGVWLTSFDGAAPGAPGTEETGEEQNDALTLKGCAQDHRQIADVLVRLRELHAAQDVELTQTSAPADEEQSSAAGASDEDGCGKYYLFEIAVTVAPEAAAAAEPDAHGAVPASLGGGQ